MQKPHSRGRRVSAAVATFLVSCGLAGGVAAAATGALSSSAPAPQPAPGMTNSGQPSWPSNAEGQTYGSLLGHNGSAAEPVLVQAIATNGQSGYVYSAQLNTSAPSSPAQAVAQQQADKAQQFIPVYAQDGTTVIGQFAVTEPSR